MGLRRISSGSNVPEEINVIIEIPMNGAPVKYEVDKATGALFVDRFLSTAMFYPVNYGYIPNTLSEDGDPVDVLVVTPLPLISGSVIRARVIGMLNMTDEAGNDAKLLAIPIKKLTNLYDNVNSYKDLPENLILSIEHFFTHYKDLEKGKWVKVEGWSEATDAHKEILDSITRAQQENND